jgi:hypothetical protein
MIPVEPLTPFVGRAPLLRRLGAMVRARKNVLLVGPAGVGKSQILEQMSRMFPLMVAHHCGCNGDLLADLEPQLKLEPGELKLPQRVHRLAAALPKSGRILVLENVHRVPPRIAHLIRVLLLHQSVWFVTRSTAPLDLGHVWPYLFLFQRVNVPPFTADETRASLSVVEFERDRSELLRAALRLHRVAAGHPGTLTALVAELRRRPYDLHTSEGLRLLTLHARISSVESQLALSA